jgi:hypothetical protein
MGQSFSYHKNTYNILIMATTILTKMYLSFIEIETKWLYHNKCKIPHFIFVTNFVRSTEKLFLKFIWSGCYVYICKGTKDSRAFTNQKR